MMNDTFYDSLETRDPEQRERDLFQALSSQLANAREYAPYLAQLLQGHAPAEVNSRAALARLPVTRKSDLMALQTDAPPFGGLAATPLSDLARVFASPGPIFEPEAQRADFWRVARALYAAGFRRGDLVHNTFSYHFSPAGSMMETGAHALGCPVFPAGVGQSELQVEAIARLRPVGYTGTPSFLRIILDKAVELGADVSSIAKALVSGEALPPSMRNDLRQRGVKVLQCYATADLGLIAYESVAMDGLIIDENVIVELLRPGTGDPVADGEVGEVVVTTLNSDYPLIRFATGDLSALLPGASPCGRSNMRIRGWMGRADQSTKVRGLFVHPSMVAQVVKRHPELGRARLEVSNADSADAMTLRCEAVGDEALKSAVAATIRDITKLRGEVEFVAPGTLPNDGKVIDDVRRYD
jgi:phenylacetate-CoA ligase